MYGNFLGRSRKVTSGTDKRWGWSQLPKSPQCYTEDPDLKGAYIDFGGNDTLRNIFEARTLTFIKYLPCVKHLVKYFTYISLFNSYSKPTK